ncbi:MAG: NAD(P)-dependent oxidoreductase [bacterium]|nr:NAD(P)-dependent oxidoreductase [bacterium]
MKIAFLGLGIMGSRMAKRLIDAGMDVTVWNRSASALDQFWNEGISTKTDIIEAVTNADVVITMLSTPQVIEDLAFGENGFVGVLNQNSIWINTSTVDPESARQFGKRSKAQGINYVDAPVAGTKQPAENGELVFYVGTESETMGRINSILDVLGKKTIHLGDVGRGSSMKMLINLLLAQSMAAFAETVKLGNALGLEQSLMHKVLTNTPVVAPFIGNIIGKLEENNTEANFPLKWMLKDIRLAENSVEEDLVLTKTIESIFEKAELLGMGDQDFSSVYHTINANS